MDENIPIKRSLSQEDIELIKDLTKALHDEFSSDILTNDYPKLFEDQKNKHFKKTDLDEIRWFKFVKDDQGNITQKYIEDL